MEAAALVWRFLVAFRQVCGLVELAPWKDMPHVVGTLPISFQMGAGHVTA